MKKKGASPPTKRKPSAAPKGGAQGGTGTSFRPHELLEAALATCVNVTLRNKGPFPHSAVITDYANRSNALVFPPAFAAASSVSSSATFSAPPLRISEGWLHLYPAELKPTGPEGKLQATPPTPFDVLVTPDARGDLQLAPETATLHGLVVTSVPKVPIWKACHFNRLCPSCRITS